MTDPRRERALAFLALLVGGAAIAFSPIFVRLADVGPMQSAFWRVALAVPLLAVWASWASRRFFDSSSIRPSKSMTMPWPG